ncbi:MAG TPA: hypothetical protein VFN90_09570 [Gemmatimonadales bacterium]|nr:hypothetical protein [Gemmatimonadales bacterium]
MIRRPTSCLVAAIALAACGPRQAPAQVAPVADTAQAGLLPKGFGILSQDFLTLGMRSVTLEIQLVPLDERVLRLLAPDAYEGLSRIQGRYRAQIDSIAMRAGVREPGVALVTFFGRAPNTRFDPLLLSMVQRNRLFRPIGFVPMSARFTAQVLDTREQAGALVIFEVPFPVFEPFSFSYLEATTDDWERKVPRIETERARILSRARPAGTER